MKKGFSLIELTVVIMLIGIVTTIGIPRFLRVARPKSEIFLSQLNTLMNEAHIKAQQSGIAQKVIFNIAAKRIEFQSITGTTNGFKVVIPDEIEIHDVSINNKSQFTAGATKSLFYLLINADGLSQEVLIAVSERVSSGGTRDYEFYLNPFTSLFRIK